MEWKRPWPAVPLICSKISARALVCIQKRKYLGAAMLTSSIFLPSDCTAQALADFEKLVIEGGAVNPRGLTERIGKASRLLFLRASDDQLVGVGALKHPVPPTETECLPMREQPYQQTNTLLSWVGSL